MTATDQPVRWPPLDLNEWRETRDTLHMWTQIVGKLKVELAPFTNQLWHTALHLTSRGLTTRPLPFGGGVIEVEFDFQDHHCTIFSSEGGRKAIPLYPRSVANFYDEMMASLEALGIVLTLNTTPQELPDPIPFPEDTIHDSYDPRAVERWWRVILSSARVMAAHRQWFVG